MSSLAVRGGEPTFSGSFPTWPVVEEEDRRALVEALDSGVWGLGGKRQEEFQAEWARFTGARYAITTSAGSTALMCALRACGVGPGDEVIIPAYTFQATATAVLMVNAVPVFADVDPLTLCLDAGSAETVITPGTRAIVPVHLAGCPADMGRLLELGDKHNLAVVEDACQAHGASWQGKGVGSIGMAGAFSFQSSKNLAAGEGGAITTSNEQVAAAAGAVRNCGASFHGLPVGPMVGTNYRMTEFQAALLLSQMRRLPEQIRRREENASILDQELAGIPGITPVYRSQDVTVHAHHLYIFRYDPASFGGASRAAFIQALQAEGIPCHGGYQPLYQASFLSDALQGSTYRSFTPGGYERLSLPVTEAACAEAVWLTQRLLLGAAEQTRAIVAAVRKIYEHREELAG